MNFKMKNQGKSYMDRYADAQEDIIKAEENQREADIEIQKTNDSPLDFTMGIIKKKVNKELETPVGQLAVKAATGGVM